MNPKILEEIKLKTELLKAVFIVLLADSSSLITMLKNQTGKPIEFTFIILGFFSTFVLLIISVLLYYEIEFIIKNS